MVWGFEIGLGKDESRSMKLPATYSGIPVGSGLNLIMVGLKEPAIRGTRIKPWSNVPDVINGSYDGAAGEGLVGGHLADNALAVVRQAVSGQLHEVTDVHHLGMLPKAGLISEF